MCMTSLPSNKLQHHTTKSNYILVALKPVKKNNKEPMTQYMIKNLSKIKPGTLKKQMATTRKIKRQQTIRYKRQKPKDTL